MSLWQRLGERADTEPGIPKRPVTNSASSSQWRTSPRPTAFLETILSGPLDGRRKLYGRLGLVGARPDRRAAVQRDSTSSTRKLPRSTGSLPGFRAARSRSSATLRRRPNAVRVMTVHGAEGPGGAVVILADATADPSRLGGVQRTLDLPVPARWRSAADPPAQGGACVAVFRTDRRR